MDILNVLNIASLKITNINGEEADLLNIFLTLNIYESILEPFLNGKLVITDTTDLIQHFPLVGNENLEIILQDQENTQIQLNFKVYKIDRDAISNRGDQKNKVVTVYFCSAEQLKDPSIHVSRKFSDKAETIIQYLLTNSYASSKTLTSEATTDTIDIYSNFWTPTKIIDFASRLAKGTYYDYIFYEDFYGFNFKPISSLIAQSSIQNVFFNIKDKSYIQNDNIKVFRTDSYFDILLSNKLGMFGSTYYKHHETEYSYTKTQDKLNDIYNSDIVSNGRNIPYDDTLSTYENMVINNFYDHDVSAVRTAVIKLLKNYNVVIKMNGHFDRKCGGVINLEFPNFDNEKEHDKAFDGHWLIVGINHLINNKNEYEQNLIVNKNARFHDESLPSITGTKSI